MRRSGEPPASPKISLGPGLSPVPWLLCCVATTLAAHWVSRAPGVRVWMSLCFPRAKDTTPRHSCCITTAPGSSEEIHPQFPVHTAAAHLARAVDTLGAAGARRGRVGGSTARGHPAWVSKGEAGLSGRPAVLSKKKVRVVA